MSGDTLKAFTEAHNAARLHPLAYERAEAERLASMARANHDNPEATWQTIPEAGPGCTWLAGLGWFKHPAGAELPPDLRALKRLFGYLAEAEHGPEEVDRLRGAVGAGRALAETQRAMGKQTLPEAVAALTGLQEAVLRALHTLKAFDGAAGVQRGDVLKKMGQGDADRVKVILNEGGEYVAHNGKVTKHRRYWLTGPGRALAEYVRLL